MYHYSGYWHSWSRVLSTNHPDGPFVEVNLTPIHGDSRGWASEVRPVRVRFHGTSREERDKIVEQLPPEVRTRMVANLGEELTERLLTEDFLPQIDPALYQQHSNGGANLEKIRRR